MSGRLRRDRLAALAVAAAALAAAIVLALLGVRMMPSYLAAWLFLLAFPLGALPIVMGMELLGCAALPIVPPLRRMLLLLPIAALFAAPVLLRLDSLYAWSVVPLPGFAGAWFHRPAFIARMIAYLVIWCALALVFCRPPPARAAAGRFGLAALGLFAHLFIATLAAIDWAMSLDRTFASSELGVLLIAAQSSTAASAAILMLGPRRLAGPALPGFVALTLTLAGAWMFTQFIQFLVIWSANLPNEAAWYLHRSSGLGAAAEWLALLAFVATLLLLPRRLARPTILFGVAALLLVTHLLEMLWLVTPDFRRHFSITLADALAMLAALLVAGAFLRAVAPGVRRRLPHGAT